MDQHQVQPGDGSHRLESTGVGEMGQTKASPCVPPERPGRRACRRPWFYVSRVTKRRSILSSRSGCANRRCSRIRATYRRTVGAQHAELRHGQTTSVALPVTEWIALPPCKRRVQNGRPQPHALRVRGVRGRTRAERLAEAVGRHSGQAMRAV